MDEPTKIEMQQLKEDVREIKTALIGNKEMNQKGLIHKVDDHDSYIEQDKKFKSKAVGIVAGIQLAIGAALAYLRVKI